MARVSRADLDFRFRSLGERGLVWIARTLHAVGRVAVRTGCWCCLAGIAAGFVVPRFVWPLMGLGTLQLLAGGAVRLAGMLVGAPLGRLRRWRLRRARRQGAITLRGRVLARRTLLSPEGQQVVAYRARFTREGRGPEIERAEPFLLDDGGPEPTLIAVENLYLADEPFPQDMVAGRVPIEGLHLLPSSGALTRYEEMWIEAGDVVAATGWLDEEVDPTLNAGFRHVGLRRVLRGRPDIPLVVRLVVADVGR